MLVKTNNQFENIFLFEFNSLCNFQFNHSTSYLIYDQNSNYLFHVQQICLATVECTPTSKIDYKFYTAYLGKNINTTF